MRPTWAAPNSRDPARAAAIGCRLSASQSSKIVDPGKAGRAERLPGRGQPRCRRPPVRQCRRGFPEHARKGAGDRPVGRAQIAVARRQGEAVRLADRRHADDLGRDVEIAGHPPDHLQLLEVLLAEIGPLALRLVEQLGDDRGDAFEMAGTADATEMVGEAGDLDLGGEARRIDLRGRRCEDQIDAGQLQQRHIARLVAWIGAEILMRAELRRVDEDGGDDAGAGLPCHRRQGQMPAVQRTHGRHQADQFAGGAEGFDARAQGGDGAYDRESHRESAGFSEARRISCFS